MNTFPNELGGSHPLAAWGNKLLRAARGCAVAPGDGYQLIESGAGTILQFQSRTKRQLPFQIYPGSTWLKFKVSTGYVITTGDSFIPTNVDTELTLTSGVAKYYFVINNITGSSADIAIASTFPTWGVGVIPIGWVDTDTYSSTSQSRIYQFLNENVFSPCI